jgi:predicted amidophosphoribosyltransferase
MAKYKYTIVNDLYDYLEKKMWKLLRWLPSPQERKKIKIIPLHSVMPKIIERVLHENSDKIILPMRGAEIFLSTLPKKLRPKVVMLEASETFPKRMRKRSFINLQEQVRSAKKICVLDDITTIGWEAEEIVTAVRHSNSGAILKLFTITQGGPTIRNRGALSKYNSFYCPVRKISTTLSIFLRKPHGLGKKEKKELLPTFFERKMQMGY